MAKEAFNFGDRFIAFLDILGIRQLLSDPAKEEKFARTVSRVIREILNPRIKGSVSLPHIRNGRRVKIGFSGWREEPGCQITSISDSIVVSLPMETEMSRRYGSPAWSAYQCLNIVFWLQRSLLQVGILTRGAVTVGKIHHTNSVVIGSGLTAAYELETQVAIYPRVVFGDSFVDLLTSAPVPVDNFFFTQRVGNLISKDRDGIYFVDYLGFDIMEMETDWGDRLTQISEFVDKELRDQKNIKAKQKLLWLEQYVKQSSARRTKGEDNSPHATEGTLEAIYPRHLSSGAQC